eukprot:g4922.t1
MDLEEEFERELLFIEQIFAFRIPPRSSAQGYKAKEWGEHVWTGSLTVTASTSSVQAKLTDPKGKLFATCPIRESGPPPMERVTDSSRYFVLRIEDPKSGRHAFIGIGFIDRGEAFNFQTTIQDYKEKLKVEKEAAEKPLTDIPSKDYSLKEGETISVQFGAKSRRSRKSTNGSDSSSGGVAVLAPPPSGGGRRRRRGNRA